MREFFQKSFQFISEHPRIIYSLVLVLFIPIAIFLNTVYTIDQFQKNIDSITHSKAIVAENIINLTAEGLLDDRSQLQDFVNRIVRDNEEIRAFDILLPSNDREKFNVIASNNPELISKKSEDLRNVLAWNQEEGIANLSSDGIDRYWIITKTINGDTGEKKGLVSLAFSLSDSDNLVNSTINRSFLVVLITILVILLLVSNQARLFGYALTVSKMKEIDKMKDNFIAMASHELRSPLTAIKAYLELYQKNDMLRPTDNRRYMENITLSVERLGSLVNDILEVSRLENNRIPINLMVVDPEPLIRRCVEEMRSETFKKELTLNFFPLNIRKIKADPERLKQIIINLISNAIKYTPKGKIDVTLTAKDEFMEITIADTGIGISADDQANLFQKFYKIQNEKTKNIESTGLGLWIASDLAKRMNGSITVESIEGVGSHFTVHIPLA